MKLYYDPIFGLQYTCPGEQEILIMDMSKIPKLPDYGNFLRRFMEMWNKHGVTIVKSKPMKIPWEDNPSILSNALGFDNWMDFQMISPEEYFYREYPLMPDDCFRGK